MKAKNHPYFRQILKDAHFLVPVIIGVVLGGFLLNGIRGTPLPLVRVAEDVRLARGVSEGPLSEVPREPAEVSFDDLISIQSEEESTIIDAREAALFALGHIPGSRNLPKSEFRAAYDEFSRHVGKETPLILYCSDAECADSRVVARALIRLGYANVRVFSGGWQEWSGAELPQAP